MVTAIFSIQLRLSLRHLPVQSGDFLWFYPVAANYAMHHVLANPFESPLSATDFRFRWHGWLYPYILAWLTTTLRLPLLTCDLLLVATNTALAVASLRAFMKPRYHSAKFLIGLAVLPPPVYLYCLAMTGRPELVAFPLVIAIIMSTSSWLYRPTLLTITCALSFGVLMCAHPTVCVLTALLWVAYLVAVLPQRELLGRLTGTAALSLMLSWALTRHFYAYGVLDWLSGLVAHARLLSSREAGPFSQFFLVDLRRPLAGPWIAVFIYALHRARRSNFISGVQSTPLLWVMLGAVTAFSWFVGVRLPQTSYNLMVFVPLMMVATLAAAIRLDRAIAMWSVVFVLSGAALLSASRLVLEGVWSGQHGTSHNEFRDDVLARIPPKATVAVPTSFLVELMGANPSFTMKRLELAGGTCDYLIKAQANSGRFLPPTVAGFTLIQNTFAKHPLRLLGVTVVNTPKAYNFALYVRSRP